MADEENPKPETSASESPVKRGNRKPVATKSVSAKSPARTAAKSPPSEAEPAKATPAKKPATAKKASPSPAKKPATAVKKPATAAKKPTQTKTPAPTKAPMRWPAIAGGAVAAVAAAGAAVFALRKPKAVEALVDKGKETTGIGSVSGSDKVDTDAPHSSTTA